MTDDIISEKGRRDRFEQWDKLEVDQVKADLQTGGCGSSAERRPSATSHGNGCG